MHETINWLKLNIAWIKELFTIIFTAAATIIGILTYKRAKETILSPMRNAVIQRQADILLELLESVDGKLNYLELVEINTIKLLSEFGFVFSNNKEVLKNIDGEVVGSIYCGSNKQIETVKIIEPFEKDAEREKASFEDYSKKRYEKLKNGEVEIEWIYITKKYQTYHLQIQKISKNPYIPKVVLTQVNTYLSEINKNLTEILKEVLKEFIIKYYDNYAEGRSIFNPIGVYNEFNHKRIHHKHSLRMLQNEIRNYMQIDKKWG